VDHGVNKSRDEVVGLFLSQSSILLFTLLSSLVIVIKESLKQTLEIEVHVCRDQGKRLFLKIVA
jgi:hypothetical protein